MNRVLVPLSLPPLGELLPPEGGRLLSLGGPTMGTTWSARCVAPPSLSAAALERRLAARLQTVIDQMSHWEPASVLRRYSEAAPGTWHPLPAEFAAVLEAALTVARETDGAYDPTLGPLVNLWGFGPEGPRAAPPDGPSIAAARARCGWRRLETGPGGLRQPGGLSLDFSSIAKGYAVDLLSEALSAAGLPSHLVEIGGELRGHGAKPDGQPWWVEIEPPPGAPAPAGRLLAALAGLAIATSGDYRRFFHAGGARFAHTIDPRTGRPAEQGLASVTVLHPRCVYADAYSTALTVLGPEAGLEFARARGLAALFVLRTPEGLRECGSPAFNAMLQ